MEIESRIRPDRSVAVSALFSDRDFATSISNDMELERISGSSYLLMFPSS
jgi:hypothetical protein